MKDEEKVENVLEKTTSSRSLRVTEGIKKEFNELRNFGNFKKMVFHKFFHYFYAVAVAYAAMKINKQVKKAFFIEDEKEILQDVQPITGNMSRSASIDSPQLEHHDDLFKMIAYWYKMKMNDPFCFRVLVAHNNKEWKENYDPRMICEKFFIQMWNEFREKIGAFGTDFPDMLLYKQLLREKKKE